MRLTLLALIALACPLSAQISSTAPESRMRPVIERYQADLASLEHAMPVRDSAARREQLDRYYGVWLDTLAKMEFDPLNQDERIDYLLLKYHVEREKRQLAIQTKKRAEEDPLIPFAQTILKLEEARQKLEQLDYPKTAALLVDLKKAIDKAKESAEKAVSDKKTPKRTVSNRAVRTLESLRGTFKHWYGFYHGYDPLFTWWAEEPFGEADKALEAYTTYVREKVVGIKPDDKTTIIGDPIGREALLEELRFEMIPYTPEELVELANKEFAWCEAEMKKASRELGYGDDWKKALEFVKTQHVEPGKQPELIRKLALEAIDFVEKRDLVTIPQLCKDTWTMEMMSPERQLQSPFFLGGDTILVSFPTNTMTHEQKMMSMRGNNIHFARATVHHELIPGHHLQGFMADRYRSWRQMFSTPFLIEGWALYWEFLLWDLNFPQSPENKIGMLFWRMHRCARIIFSLSFHLDKMTPQQCVDFLVERVGHERDNAAAEVRRSFQGGYSPLYQCAYMLGGLQLRSLHKELVESGKMTDKQFHDSVLQQNSISIALIRAALTNQPLTKDYKNNWRFYK